MHPLKTRFAVITALGIATSLAACAALRDVVRPPEFSMAGSQSSQIRLLGPGQGRPLGGAELRVWARVSNPNPFGFTLATLSGDVLLRDQHAARVNLPLGLPLQAAQDTVIPLDVTISFADVPQLADQLLGALTGEALQYALHGTVAVDAGALGQPSFGPTTWLSGEVQVVR